MYAMLCIYRERILKCVVGLVQEYNIVAPALHCIYGLCCFAFGKEYMVFDFNNLNLFCIPFLYISTYLQFRCIYMCYSHSCIFVLCFEIMLRICFVCTDDDKGCEERNKNNILLHKEFST